MSTALQKNSLNNLEPVLVWKCITNNSRPWESAEGNKKNKKKKPEKFNSKVLWYGAAAEYYSN